MSARFTVTGIADVLAALDAFKESARSALLASALRKCLAPVKRRAKSLAPRSNTRDAPALTPGLLAKSIQLKVRLYRSEGRALGIVGPARGYRRFAGVRAYGKSAGKAWYQDPVHYAHLVEKGAKGRRGTITPRPFLQPAVDSEIGRFPEVFRAEIEAVIAKLAAKGKLRDKLTSAASEHWVGNVEDL